MQNITTECSNIMNYNNSNNNHTLTKKLDMTQKLSQNRMSELKKKENESYSTI